jgi:hypothetical protein
MWWDSYGRLCPDAHSAPATAHEWKRGGSRGSMENVFGDLYKGISAHFALEERSMRERVRPTRPHKNDHERLLDELRDIMEISPTRRRPRALLPGGSKRGFQFI